MIVYEITRSDLTKKNFNNKTVICTDEKETVNFDTNVVCHAKRKKLTSKIQKNPPEKKLPGGFKTYLNGFIMPF